MDEIKYWLSTKRISPQMEVLFYYKGNIVERDFILGRYLTNYRWDILLRLIQKVHIRLGKEFQHLEFITNENRDDSKDIVYFDFVPLKQTLSQTVPAVPTVPEGSVALEP